MGLNILALERAHYFKQKEHFEKMISELQHLHSTEINLKNQKIEFLELQLYTEKAKVSKLEDKVDKYKQRLLQQEKA